MRSNEQLIGAAAERKAVLAYLRRQQNFSGNDSINIARWWALQNAVVWLLDRNERYRSRAGGLQGKP